MMRWINTLSVVAAFAACVTTAAQAGNTITYTFQYDPDNPDNPEGYTQFDGHIRAGRAPLTEAGYNDENWSGSNSLQVWLPGELTRMGIVQMNGWEDEVGDDPIVDAYLNLHLRFNISAPANRPQVVEVRPMLVDVEIGNGDGLVPPDERWMTWGHRAASILDPENGRVCDTCVGWRDGLSRNGPFADFDYASEPVVRSIVTPDFFDEETPDRNGDGIPDENRWQIDATQIFQDWQNGVYPNFGLHLWGVEADPKADPPTARTRLYFHGADTHLSGAKGAIKDRPFSTRYLPELVITVERAVLKGDVNNDGIIDFIDITPFINAQSAEGDEDAFLLLTPDGCFLCADIDMDGSVDFIDITPFVNLLDEVAGAVPEPTTAMLLVMMGLVTARRRRR